MADLKFGAICLLYITLSLVSISGLIWLTDFSFKAKVASVRIDELNIKFTEVEDVDISDNNLTGSKIAIVAIWIQIFVSLVFVIYKLYKHVR
jgi:hypothetical protein